MNNISAAPFFFMQSVYHLPWFKKSKLKLRDEFFNDFFYYRFILIHQ